MNDGRQIWQLVGFGRIVLFPRCSSNMGTSTLARIVGEMLWAIVLAVAVGDLYVADDVHDYLVTNDNFQILHLYLIHCFSTSSL